MDLFSRTMLASSAEAGLNTTTLSRHVPLLRRNIGPTDRVELLTGCIGSDGLGSGDHMLMLTSERIVVTRQSRLLGRVRLCIDAPVTAVENLRWSADPNGPGVELNFTVLEGPGAAAPRRWHFWLPASHAKRVWRIDALLARAFRRPQAMATPMIAAQTLPRVPIRHTWAPTRSAQTAMPSAQVTPNSARAGAHGTPTTKPRDAQPARETGLRTNLAAA